MVGHTAFETLSRLVESLEDQDTSPEAVEATMHEGKLRASLTVPVDLSADGAKQGNKPKAVDIDTDGSLSVTYKNPIRKPIEAASGVRIESESAQHTEVDGFVLTVELAIESRGAIEPSTEQPAEPTRDVGQRPATGVE